ncbi:hypothetical protein D3C81_670790 [compost metagenome]
MKFDKIINTIKGMSKSAKIAIASIGTVVIVVGGIAVYVMINKSNVKDVYMAPVNDGKEVVDTVIESDGSDIKQAPEDSEVVEESKVESVLDNGNYGEQKKDDAKNNPGNSTPVNTPSTPSKPTPQPEQPSQTQPQQPAPQPQQPAPQPEQPKQPSEWLDSASNQAMKSNYANYTNNTDENSNYCVMTTEVFNKLNGIMSQFSSGSIDAGTASNRISSLKFTPYRVEYQVGFINIEVKKIDIGGKASSSQISSVLGTSHYLYARAYYNGDSNKTTVYIGKAKVD